MEKLKIKKEDMIDLNEGNVKKLFSRCKSNPATLPQNLFSSKFIHSKDSALESKFTFTFDKKQLDKYRAQIEFLIGQLRSIHLKESVMLANNAAIKYDQSVWSTNPATIISLLSLADATALIGNARYTDNVLYIHGISKYLNPTVSPDDPRLSDFVEIISGKEPEAH